jgi:hypothetical protein
VMSTSGPIEQIVAPETFHPSDKWHEAILHSSREFCSRASSHLVLSDAGEHVLPPQSASGTAFDLPSGPPLIIARANSARLFDG